ncbi:MAG: HAD family acid phosphatase [Thermoanaerobaculia bacterium]|jgi:acid phosphatase
MNGKALIGILCLASLGCAHSTTAPVAAPPVSESDAYYGQEMLQGVAWMQTSVEYRALAMQAYTNATRALDAALADPTWNALEGEAPLTAGLRPAVILDIDETCVDNSGYEATLLQAKELHTEDRFDEFVRAGAVGTVPGAKAFLDYAISRGVDVFYVTNQNVRLEPATRENLRKLGLPLDATRDNLLTVGERPDWVSDKTSRRLFVAQDHRVILLLGDDFNDFVNASGKSLEERRAQFDRYAGRFGAKWFIIPNPVYGSWDRSLTAGAGKRAKEKFELKLKSLRVTAGD